MAKTYGIIVDTITGNYQVPLFTAIKKLARLAEINLIVFEGGAFQDRQLRARQNNIIYTLMNDNHIDGYIIFSSSVFHCFPADKGIHHILATLDQPVISLNVDVPGLASIMIDNQSGIKEAVKHLANVHNLKNIAFVTGPNSNAEANKRLAAYMATLKELDIKINPEWIIPGHFHPEDGIEAIKKLSQYPELEAVVFANDDMAMGAQEYLAEHNPSLLDKLAMTGFDNLPSASLVPRPLTSVAQPFNDIALKAFELLSELTNDKAVVSSTQCKTYLDIKSSCGCDTGSNHYNPVKIINYAPTIHEFIQSYDEEEIFDELDKSLSQLQIHDCVIVKYSQPCELPDFEASLPTDAHVSFAYIKGERLDVTSKQNFNPVSLLPPNLKTSLHQVTLVVKPLFFNKTHYGYILIDASGDNYANIEPLCGHLSTCLLAKNCD